MAEFNDKRYIKTVFKIVLSALSFANVQNLKSFGPWERLQFTLIISCVRARARVNML